MFKCENRFKWVFLPHNWIMWFPNSTRYDPISDIFGIHFVLAVCHWWPKYHTNKKYIIKTKCQNRQHNQGHIKSRISKNLFPFHVRLLLSVRLQLRRFIPLSTLSRSHRNMFLISPRRHWITTSNYIRLVLFGCSKGKWQSRKKSAHRTSLFQLTTGLTPTNFFSFFIYVWQCVHHGCVFSMLAPQK